MPKAKNKTIENNQDVLQFLNNVEDPKRRKDSIKLLEIITELTNLKPKMWGSSIVGFGKYHYKYATGREGEFMKTGFAPRKQSLTLYIMPGFDRYEESLKMLGKYTTGKSCLYIKKLEDVNIDVLKQLISESVDYMTQKYDNS